MSAQEELLLISLYSCIVTIKGIPLCCTRGAGLPVYLKAYSNNVSWKIVYLKKTSPPVTKTIKSHAHDTVCCGENQGQAAL